jgi:GNAT superfamily N-acetyltransferase
VYTQLGTATLKTGAPLACGVVVAPDAAWAPRINTFLAHLRAEWRFHTAQALAQPLDALETRFYVGTLGAPQGPIVTLVMVASARGVGLLGYVYTAPEHRRLGAYSALMAFQMEDCRALGHHTLTLTTGFESPAYWIYHRFGFRSIDGTSGRMTWLAAPDAEARWFRPGATAVHPLAWDDWSTLNLTALRLPDPAGPPEDLPRSWAFRLLTCGTAEGTFPQVFAPWSRQPRRAARQAITLRTEHGAVAGWLVLIPDDLTYGSATLVDLHVHPAFRQDAPKLLAAVRWPDAGRLTAYTAEPAGYRAALLEGVGFRRVATLPGWLEHDGARLDLDVLLSGD